MPTQEKKEPLALHHLVLGLMETQYAVLMAQVSTGVGVRRWGVEMMYGRSHPLTEISLAWSGAMFPLVLHTASMPWYVNRQLFRAYLPPEKPSKVD